MQRQRKLRQSAAESVIATFRHRDQADIRFVVGRRQQLHYPPPTRSLTPSPLASAESIPPSLLANMDRLPSTILLASRYAYGDHRASPRQRAITVNAGLGNVILAGLEVDGAEPLITASSSIRGTVSNCIVDIKWAMDSSGNGIMTAPTWAISTSPSSRQSSRITEARASIICRLRFSDGNRAIDHLIAGGNATGIATTRLPPLGALRPNISNSVANNNTSDGIVTASASGTVSATMDRDGNQATTQRGVSIGTNTSVLLSRSASHCVWNIELCTAGSVRQIGSPERAIATSTASVIACMQQCAMEVWSPRRLSVAIPATGRAR